MPDQNFHVPARMNAVRLHKPGGPAGLICEEIETPRPGPREVLVRVHAAAITRDELDWPVDRLPAIPCYELSGVVADAGPGVSRVSVSEAVYALSSFERDGAAADYMVIAEDLLAPKPKKLDHAEGAALPMPGLTAWQALFDHGKLSEGQRVLIHGATGGVGHIAVQLAQAYGAHVMGTVTGGNIGAARASGIPLDEVIDDAATPFEEIVKDVDLVLDTVGGDRLTRSYGVIRRGGRLVSVAKKPSQEQAQQHGIEALFFIVEPNGDQLRELSKLADRGDLKPAIREVFPLDDARTAFEHSLNVHGSGKIVLQIAEE